MGDGHEQYRAASIVAVGPLLCLLSAAGFGAMAVFGKLAYDAGVGVGDLLLVRFALAAAACSRSRRRRGVLRGLPRRVVLAGLAMGAIGYAAQSGLFFAALERMDASLLALILYVYPATVLRRRRGARARAGDAAAGRRAGRRARRASRSCCSARRRASSTRSARALGFAAAVTYTVYILTGDRVGAGVSPLALAALVCAGATCTFAARRRSRAAGRSSGFGATGWAAIGGHRARLHRRRDPAVLRRAGAGRAERGVDPLDAGAGGDRRARGRGVRRVALAVQLLGGALVLGAVVVMQWPARAACAANARRIAKAGGAPCADSRYAE